MPEVQDQGRSGEGWHGAEVPAVPPRVSHQGRHPGHAHRRSHDRTLNRDLTDSSRARRVKILLLRLRLIGDVMFTTPLIRALRRAYPGGASRRTLSSPPRRRWCEHNPSSRRGDRRAARRAACGGWRTTCRWRGGCGASGFDLAIDLHGGPRSAWLTLGERRAASGSATTSRGGAGCTRAVVHRAPRTSAAALGARTSGICSRRSRGGAVASRRPRAIRSRWRSTRQPTTGWPRRLRDAGVPDATS